MILTYQPRWTVARAAVIAREIRRRGVAFDSIVDMGAYEGDMAALVTRWTSDLRRDSRGVAQSMDARCEEGRPINLDIGRFKYPDFEWAVVDYETCDLAALPAADVVLCCGLIYHFSADRTEAVLRAAIRRTRRLLVIDSEVVDALDGGFSKVTPEGRHDHGLTAEREWIPSVGWVEAVLRSEPGTVTRIDSDDLSDGERHQRYAWVAENAGAYAGGQRRFWMVWK